GDAVRRLWRFPGQLTPAPKRAEEIKDVISVFLSDWRRPVDLAGDPQARRRDAHRSAILLDMAVVTRSSASMAGPPLRHRRCHSCFFDVEAISVRSLPEIREIPV
ncbi:MAG: hypothetical protein ACRET2_04310, partial [Steroidobacteraceae bacterium]